MTTDLPADDGRRFFTVEEAARCLNLSPKHLRRDIKAKKLRVHRFGRAQRISPEDLEDYTRRHRQ
jgi:excisionase family DNA binding protein